MSEISNPRIQIYFHSEAGQETPVAELELFQDIAPRHVQRVIELAREGYYDNCSFHRVVDGHVAQWGSWQDDGLGESGKGKLQAELSDIPFDRGVLGMARDLADIDSGDCQLFVCLDARHRLNGMFTVLGKVVSGMEYFDQLTRISVTEKESDTLDMADQISRIEVVEGPKLEAVLQQ